MTRKLYFVNSIVLLTLICVAFAFSCRTEHRETWKESWKVSDEMMRMIAWSEVKLSAQGEEQLKSTNAIVPLSALVFDHNKNYVVLFREPDHADVREVTVLSRSGDQVRVCCGFKAGEKVITNYHLFIYTALMNQ